MKIMSTEKVRLPSTKPKLVYSIMVYSPYGIYEVQDDKLYQHKIEDGPTEYKSGLILDKSKVHKCLTTYLPFPHVKESMVEEHYDMGKFTIIVSGGVSFTGSIPDILNYVNQYKGK